MQGEGKLSGEVRWNSSSFPRKGQTTLVTTGGGGWGAGEPSCNGCGLPWRQGRSSSQKSDECYQSAVNRNCRRFLCVELGFALCSVRSLLSCSQFLYHIVSPVLKIKVILNLYLSDKVWVWSEQFVGHFDYFRENPWPLDTGSDLNFSYLMHLWWYFKEKQLDEFKT